MVAVTAAVELVTVLPFASSTVAVTVPRLPPAVSCEGRMERTTCVGDMTTMPLSETICVEPTTFSALSLNIRLPLIELRVWGL